jgi:hypothetical protein
MMDYGFRALVQDDRGSGKAVRAAVGQVNPPSAERAPGANRI